MSHALPFAFVCPMTYLSSACDRLLTHADHRLTIDQIKSHAYFYGVDWSTIRNIDAPFVPHLRSLTDTSYFPTEDLDQVPDLPPPPQDNEGAARDLAFLGYT